MDLLEHQAILGRLQRKHRKAQEEAAALRAQVEEFKSTPPRPDFSSSPPKPAYGRRICVGSCCTRLDAGFSAGWAYDGASPLNSPATGAVSAPPPARWISGWPWRPTERGTRRRRRKGRSRRRGPGWPLSCLPARGTRKPPTPIYFALRGAFGSGPKPKTPGWTAGGANSDGTAQRTVPYAFIVFYLYTHTTMSTSTCQYNVPVRVLKAFVCTCTAQATQHSHDVLKNNESTCCSNYV